MDKSAIQQLQALSIAAAGFGADPQSPISHADIPIIMLPEGFKIESLEKFEFQPSMHKETFKTKYIGQFLEYTLSQENGKVISEPTTVFISEKPMQASAIFDRSSPDTPSWQNHQAKLILENTPALEALLTTNSRNLNQTDLIDFAIDWKEVIQFFDGEEALELPEAIARFRNLKITEQKTAQNEQGDFKATRTALEKIEIDAAGKPLPSHFHFTTPPYMEFNEQVYSAQIRALGDDNKPQLRYRLIQLPLIEQKIAEEFKQRIQDALLEAQVYIGSI